MALQIPTGENMHKRIMTGLLVALLSTVGLSSCSIIQGTRNPLTSVPILGEALKVDNAGATLVVNRIFPANPNEKPYDAVVFRAGGADAVEPGPGRGIQLRLQGGGAQLSVNDRRCSVTPQNDLTCNLGKRIERDTYAVVYVRGLANSFVTYGRANGLEFTLYASPGTDQGTNPEGLDTEGQVAGQR